jgi:hypothetical protein
MYGEPNMMNKVRWFLVKIEPFALALASFGVFDILVSIYSVMWSEHKIVVLATGIMFASLVATWWADYLNRKIVRKLLDNF